MRSATCLVMGNSSCGLVSTSAACLHRQKYVYRFICSGIASGHICDQSGAILPLALCKRLFDVLHKATQRFKTMRSRGLYVGGSDFLSMWSLRKKNDSSIRIRRANAFSFSAPICDKQLAICFMANQDRCRYYIGIESFVLYHGMSVTLGVQCNR